MHSSDVAPKEVPLDQVVLGVQCCALVDSKEKGTTVVLKHLRVDGCCHGRWKSESR